MADYLKEIYNGLIIEEPKTILPWNLQKKDFFDKFKCIKTVNENYYVVKIVLSGIFFISFAGLHFKKERLAEVELFNNEKDFSESEISNVFSNHQLILENSFGKPCRNKLLKNLKRLIKNISGNSDM